MTVSSLCPTFPKWMTTFHDEAKPKIIDEKCGEKASADTPRRKQSLSRQEKVNSTGTTLRVRVRSKRRQKVDGSWRLNLAGSPLTDMAGKAKRPAIYHITTNVFPKRRITLCRDAVA